MRKLIDSGFVTVIRPEAPIEPLKSMKQQSLAETGFLPKVGKPTPKVGFLAEMDTVVSMVAPESTYRTMLFQERYAFNALVKKGAFWVPIIRR